MNTSVKGCCKVSIEELSIEELKNLANGEEILSCRIIPFAELDDNMLANIYEHSGYEWVLHNRPDWIAKYHPEHLN